MAAQEPDEGRLGPTHTVARFDIKFTSYLDPHGELTIEGLPESAANADTLVAIYRAMRRTRSLDAKCVNLQRTGQLGTYGSNLGQEAVGVCVAAAMRDTDVLVPTYRELGAQLWRGVSMEETLLYWGGDERGSDFALPREDLPICIPIASHALHAVGVAYAMKLRREPRVAVCFIGDGATSKGDFYEAANAAGVWRVPILFVVTNNRWAISMPREKQSAAQTMAQKALAAGFNGEQVDGNDAIALYVIARAAIHRARHGGGPQLVEALTYRMSDHTTSDDWRRYRDATEVEAARALDPCSRLGAYLEDQGRWGAEQEAALSANIDEQIENAVRTYLAMPPQAPESMFDFLHEALPAGLSEQREAVRAEGEENG